MKAEKPDELVRLSTAAAWELENASRVALALSRAREKCVVSLVPEAGTARIYVRGGVHRIELAPDFLEKWIETPAELLFLLLHEILHRIHGDLLRKPPADPLERSLVNLVADVRINSWLVREFFPRGMPLLERFYAGSKLPGLLLVPPDRLIALRGPELGIALARDGHTLGELGALRRADVTSALAKIFTAEGLKGRPARRLACWHLDAWTDHDPSHDFLLERLRELVAGLADRTIVFLGSHDGRAERGEEPYLGEAFGELEEALEAGTGHALEEDTIAVARPAPVESLKKLIRLALTPTGSAPLPVVQRSARGVIPELGRREAFLLAAGVWPVFFPQAIPALDEGGHVHVYVDVSGSTKAYQPTIYGIVRDLGRTIAEPAYLFSNEVVPMPLELIRRGRRGTTGGTDFDCVVEHAVKSGWKKILVVTDGEGPIRDENAEHLKDKIELYVLFTGYPVQPLFMLAKTSWTLPEWVEVDPVESGEVPF